MTTPNKTIIPTKKPRSARKNTKSITTREILCFLSENACSHKTADHFTIVAPVYPYHDKLYSLTRARA
jgi:hypothetical protein